MKVLRMFCSVLTFNSRNLAPFGSRPEFKMSVSNRICRGITAAFQVMRLKGAFLFFFFTCCGCFDVCNSLYSRYCCSANHVARLFPLENFPRNVFCLDVFECAAFARNPLSKRRIITLTGMQMLLQCFFA